MLLSGWRSSAHVENDMRGNGYEAAAIFDRFCGGLSNVKKWRKAMLFVTATSIDVKRGGHRDDEEEVRRVQRVYWQCLR